MFQPACLPMDCHCRRKGRDAQVVRGAAATSSSDCACAGSPVTLAGSWPPEALWSAFVKSARVACLANLSATILPSW
ncbi:hypothetical protein C2845_PM03G05340 [Panicum miliaceum]|uniref:Uncharacterized protein n=1 Tax=Panicum miliaceum TaxID=4540 RepID=A0A3L6T859_PANMI|nr:hypothetical protein C2845_PM03G05340 [Panicum miliaceum]